ncbi:MAG: hypothetical protein Q9167_005069 [Letrouitia subvulpina]
MVVRIRLARFGKRNKPFYNIVVAQARSARNSKPLEVIGTYDPIPRAPPPGSPDEAKPFKDIKIDSARAKYWIGVGAQPSEPAWRLLSMVSFLRYFREYKGKKKEGNGIGKSAGKMREIDKESCC